MGTHPSAARTSMELRQVGTLLLLIPAQGDEDSLVDQFLVGDTELLEDDLASGSAFLKKAMATAAAAAKKAFMAAVAKKASASIKKVSASVKKADAISESNGKVTQPSNLAYGSNHKLN